MQRIKSDSPYIVAILIFDAIASLLFLLFLSTYIVVPGDLAVVVGMLGSVIYLFFTQKNRHSTDFIKMISFTAIIGGLIVSLSLPLIFFLLLLSVGYSTGLFDYFLEFAPIYLLISFGIALLAMLGFKLYQKLYRNEINKK